MSVKDSFRRLHIPQYNRNAVIQLVAASGVGFVGIHLLWITLIVYAVPVPRANQLTFEYVGIAGWDVIRERWWTVFTYGWCHKGFWEWLSNMLWLYCFGNVVQTLVGYKQIIPMFVYAILAGGLAFAGCQLIPGVSFPPAYLVMGAQAGIMALMTAAFTLSPRYRLYLGEYFSFPLWLLAIVFTALMVLNSGLLVPSLVMLAGGALVGFVYIRLLKSGYKPGEWVYDLYSRMDTALTPAADRKKNSSTTRKVPLNTAQANRQHQIDRVLDKINEKGYQSLSKEERQLLEDQGK